MQTDNLELKKLVYLYLMNYAKSQPDMAIMAVNTFVKVGAGWGWEGCSPLRSPGAAPLPRVESRRLLSTHLTPRLGALPPAEGSHCLQKIRCHRAC